MFVFDEEVVKCFFVLDDAHFKSIIGEFYCSFGYSSSLLMGFLLSYMALVEKTVLVAHSSAQMFNLVDGVEAYPEFLPWCASATMTSVDEQTVHASVEIDYHHLKQKFTTKNVRIAPHQIDMTLQEGPFKHLDGSWRFVALNDTACKIEFRLHYEFSSKIIEKLMGPVFHYIANSLVDAFVQRAEKVY